MVVGITTRVLRRLSRDNQDRRLSESQPGYRQVRRICSIRVCSSGTPSIPRFRSFGKYSRHRIYTAGSVPEKQCSWIDVDIRGRSPSDEVGKKRRACKPGGGFVPFPYRTIGAGVIQTLMMCGSVEGILVDCQDPSRSTQGFSGCNRPNGYLCRDHSCSLKCSCCETGGICRIAAKQLRPL
ncbi:hypothetical protein ElyMa_004412900 [Elysia marginata]|uniref:Uncharacterized protein n=1 Tax=Elysia marginata TaxID=1093978 RepID=A0AAV4HCL8_9GAST|nr:hypothetical protein ElyMa_004412900 [Elysia marginata]